MNPPDEEKFHEVYSKLNDCRTFDEFLTALKPFANKVETVTLVLLFYVFQQIKLERDFPVKRRI